MLTLAIDTAVDRGSVALGEAGTVLGVRTFSDRRHAAELVPSMVELMGEAGRGVDELERIVVGNGPGSFTGIRIGYATAYGIRRAHPPVELLTIPSIAAAASAVGRREGGVVAALYDALRGDVFVAVYRFGEEGMETICPPQLAPLHGIPERFPMVERVTGDAAVLGTDVVLGWSGAGAAHPDDYDATAVEMLHLAALGGQAAVVGTGESFVPDYGRLAEAQVRWEREHGVELPHR